MRNVAKCGIKLHQKELIRKVIYYFDCNVRRE